MLLFWCFNTWGFADSEGTAPPRDCQFLEIINNSPFVSKNNPEPIPQPLPLLGSFTHYPTALIISGPVQVKTVPMPQSLLQSFILVNPTPDCPALTIPSHINNSKGSCPCVFPLLLLPPDQPWSSQCGRAWGNAPTSLGNCDWQTAFSMTIIPWSVKLSLTTEGTIEKF